MHDPSLPVPGSSAGGKALDCHLSGPCILASPGNTPVALSYSGPWRSGCQALISLFPIFFQAASTRVTIGINPYSINLFCSEQHFSIDRCDGIDDIDSMIQSKDSHTAGRGVMKVGVLTVDKVSVDGRRFQFKVACGREGTRNGTVQAIEVWNPYLAGIVSVWKEPKTKRVYVVNGHHRLAAAKRLGVGKLVVQALNVKTDTQARACGAQINMAEGTALPLDVAKFARDTGATADDLSKQGISLRSALVSDGLALATLPEALFSAYVMGKLPHARAVALGGTGLEGTDLIRLAALAEKQKLTPSQVKEAGRLARDGPQHTETQGTLFGPKHTRSSLIAERAKVTDYVLGRLGKEERLMRYVSAKDRAARLAETDVAEVDVDRAKSLAGPAAQARALFRRFSVLQGATSEAINKAAQRIAQGERVDRVCREEYSAIVDAVASELV